MSNIVLIHGAFQGGWIWKQVNRLPFISGQGTGWVRRACRSDGALSWPTSPRPRKVLAGLNH